MPDDFSLVPVEHNPFGIVGQSPVLQIDPMAQGMLQRAANANVSQQEIKESLPPPLSRLDRNWQNYGQHMKPDEVMDSETVWGTAQEYADAGLGRAEGFATAANDLWKRMGANRMISPEYARKYMFNQNFKLVPVEHDPFNDQSGQ